MAENVKKIKKIGNKEISVDWNNIDNIPIIDQEIKSGSENAVSSDAVYEGFLEFMMSITHGSFPFQVLSFNGDYNLAITEDENYGRGVYLVDSEGIPLFPFILEEGIRANYANYAEYATLSDYAWGDQDGRILKGSDIDYPIDYGNGTVDCYIMDGYSHYCGLVGNSLICSISGEVGDGFSSALYFATPPEIPEDYSQFPDSIHFKGDSTDKGAFVPEANMIYTIYFDFDGYRLNGYVSGVEMANEEETVSEEETV